MRANRLECKNSSRSANYPFTSNTSFTHLYPFWALSLHTDNHYSAFSIIHRQRSYGGHYNERWLLSKKLFDALREGVDMQDLSIDGTYIKAHRASTGAKKGMWTEAKISTLALVAGEDPLKYIQ